MKVMEITAHEIQFRYIKNILSQEIQSKLDSLDLHWSINPKLEWMSFQETISSQNQSDS